MISHTVIYMLLGLIYDYLLLPIGLNPTGGMDVCLFECCALSGRGLCDELIICPEESYRLVRRHV